MARPKIRVRFKYNIDTGEIEEFFVDDNQPSASEAAHDQRARAVASRLARAPDIQDAGPIPAKNNPQPATRNTPCHPNNAEKP